ncbi:hypothetical protein E0H26_16325 [Micromonospora zingiberis]|uniref:Uncharacterized protein n=1 Tax=Micromonospora zingiberis TaxID=2053011 RepID=A0A4R0GHK4_9ACTN|nr:hypothetical protein E0H26_16325 [Micromonospora zingiberis]
MLSWLIHPVTVAATALLILNDHVLKAAYPGWLTGKLSDVAGLVMAPPLLALLLAACARLTADSARLLAGRVRLVADSARLLAGRVRLVADSARLLAGCARLAVDSARLLAGRVRLTAGRSRLLAGRVRLVGSVRLAGRAAGGVPGAPLRGGDRVWLAGLWRTAGRPGPQRGPDGRDLLAAGSILLVGVGFAAVKATQAGATTASALWSVVNGPSVILADVTDLLALPALGLAWWTWRSAANRPTLVRWLRMVAVLVVLPIAGLGVAATSAPQYDDAVQLYEWQDVAVVGVGNAYHGNREPYRWQVSQDDGPSFTELPEHRRELFQQQLPTPASGSDCSTREPTHCFRVVPRRLAVQESRDGGATWQLAWEVDEDARARLGVAMPAMGDVEEYLSSRALLVRDQPDGGVVVLVANGRDGVARRDTTGRWKRIGFGAFTADGFRAETAAMPIPSVAEATVTAGWRVAVPLSIVVGSFVALVGCATLLVRRSGWPLVAAIAPAAALNLLGLVAFIPYAMAGANSDELLAPLFVVAVTLGLSLLPAGAIVLTTAVTERSRGVAGRFCLAGLLGGTLVWLPYLLRVLTGWPQQHTLTDVAVATAVAVVLISVPLAIRYVIRVFAAQQVEQAQLDPPWPLVDGGQRST